MNRSATVVITTKNRKDELRTAIQSALIQTARPEVLVIDDGSSDGTSDMVRAEFPTVTLHRSEQSAGLIAQRNRGAECAKGDILFSIDDDAAFSSPHVVEQTLTEFSHPRIGAIAMPFIDVNKDNVLQQRAPDDAAIHVTAAYVGTAHALRRDLFLKLGGYRSHLVHQGEEGDFTIRLLAAGYVVALGRADPIHHFESPKRSSRRMAVHGRRNDILFGWHNVPLVDLPLRWIRATAGGIRHGVTKGQFIWSIEGLACGYGATVKYFGERAPVSRDTYRLYRRLAGKSLPLTEVEPHLPPMI